MMFRQLTSLLLAALLALTPAELALAAPMTVSEKLAAIETDTYGGEQAGALLSRTSRLEKDYNGRNMQGQMSARVDALYDQVFGNDAGPSILAQVNALEWNLSHEVSAAPVEQRIQDLELEIQGETRKGTLVQRMQELMDLSFGSGSMPMAQATVPANTLVRIALVTPINAKTIKVGDTVHYQVAEDVIVDGRLMFAKGEPGDGTVTKVRQARNFGRSAVVEVEFERVKAIQGTYVDTFLGDEAKEETAHMAMAAGASVAAMVLLGPVGIVAGGFVKGKNIDIPAGAELYIQTKADTSLYGLSTEEPTDTPVR